MRMPKDTDIDLAILWLQHNEGDGDEAVACKAVAEWLDHMKLERMIKSTAKVAGTTPAAVRRRLNELAERSEAHSDQDNDHRLSPK